MSGLASRSGSLFPKKTSVASGLAGDSYAITLLFKDNIFLHIIYIMRHLKKYGFIPVDGGFFSLGFISSAKNAINTVFVAAGCCLKEKYLK